MYSVMIVFVNELYYIQFIRLLWTMIFS